MAFEIQRTKVKVNIYGTWYELRSPIVKEALDMAEMSKTKKDEGGRELVDYVESLGLPRDVIEGMEQEHFLSLLEYLSKKKTGPAPGK